MSEISECNQENQELILNVSLKLFIQAVEAAPIEYQKVIMFIQKWLYIQRLQPVIVILQHKGKGYYLKTAQAKIAKFVEDTESFMNGEGANPINAIDLFPPFSQSSPP